MIRMRFTGGVFDGAQLALAAPYTPEIVWLAESPDSQIPALLVGTERMPPGPLFTSAVEYRLDRDASDLRDHPTYDGMEIGDARYESAN